jgi:general secretion pathway protein G
MAVRRKRNGFTLIELVIVVLVLGIIAAIAAPKLFNVTDDARKNGTRQSLTTIRNSIELFRSTTGAYPASKDTIQKDLDPLLQGTQFPIVQVGANINGNVRAFTAPFSASGTEGWAYDAATGEFLINDAAYQTW